MNKLTKALTLTAALALAPLSVSAAQPYGADHEYSPHLVMYMQNTVTTWIANPTIIDAIKAQNARTEGMSEADILALDTEWRAAAPEDAIISDVTSNAASVYLRQMVDVSGGMVTEVFITDKVGLNVAASVPTSDYWQGDEDKHAMSFGNGAGAIHVGDLEVDQSTGAFQSQVSMTIIDPLTGDPIGAITLGVTPDMF